MILQVFDFDLRHLFGREVEDLFREQLQDDHIVFTEGEVGFGRLDQFSNEVWPVVRPLLLEDLRRELVVPRNLKRGQPYLHQCKVQLVYIGLLLPHRGFIRRHFDRDTNNKVPDTLKERVEIRDVGHKRSAYLVSAHLVAISIVL